MTRELQPDVRRRSRRRCRRRRARSTRARRSATCPIAGHVVYALDPEWITLGQSWAATPKTYVEFEGRTAYGERSHIPFHVTSLDWQESDRVLAGIMTAFGSPTGARADRRLGRVRRRDAASASRSRASRALQRRAHARVGHDLGRRHREGRDREQLRRRQRKRRSPTGRSRDHGRGPVLARLSAQGQRRRDQRAHPHHAAAARGSAPRVRARRLSGRRARLRRIPPLRQVRDAVRLRPAADRRGARRTASRSRPRPRRCASRAPASGSTGSTSRRAPARSPAPRGSAGTATTRSTPTARGFRSSR